VVASEVMFNDVFGSNMNAWMTSQKHPARVRDWERWKREHLADGSYSEIEEVGRCA
jgi:hypothetical protein